MYASDLTALIHFVGFITGIVLYGMLGTMTLRERGRSNRIPVATALLGVAWNSVALVAYTSSSFGLGNPPSWLVALGFAALGMLPAVVVHSTAQGAPRTTWRLLLVRAAWALSALAGVIHIVVSVRSSTAPSSAALVLLATGYLAVIAMMAVTIRDRNGAESGSRRGPSLVGLAAFAIMALHLSQHPEGSGTWSTEILGHHASLPLALVILYQDYRFALADLFLKRALTLLAVITLAITLYAGIAARLVLPGAAGEAGTVPGDEGLAPGAGATALLLGLWILTIFAYPLVRRWVDRLVDRLLLRRPDYRVLRGSIEESIASLASPEDVLDSVCRALEPALSATRVNWREIETHDSAAPLVSLNTLLSEQHAVVRVPATDAPEYVIEVGGLTGGRRLLSDDVAMLEAIALVTARRIDALRVTRERYERTLREREITQLATEAELRALRAQLNPHFLFNALTTIAHLVDESPSRARQTLYRLTGLLRAVLRRSEGEFTTLGEELDLVESYLAIERTRFEERLEVHIDVPAALRARLVPPFVLQPLVENAIKHGIAKRREGGRVAITARVEADGEGGRELLHLRVSDSGPGVNPLELARRRAKGVGLSSVEQRLERYFDRDAFVVVESVAGAGTTVALSFPAGTHAAPDDRASA